MKTFLLLIHCLIISTFLKAETTFISFQVENPQAKEIEMRVLTEEGYDLYIVKLDDKNEVSTALELEKNTFVDIQHNEQTFKMFLRPGDMLTVYFSSLSIASSLSYNIKELGAENNQLLADYFAEFSGGEDYLYEEAHLPFVINHHIFNKAKNSSVENYFPWINEQKDSLNKIIEHWQHIAVIDEEVVHFLLEDLKYNFESQKISYLIINQQKIKNNIDWIVEKNNITQEEKYFSDEALKHPSYQNYLMGYAHLLYMMSHTSHPDIGTEYYDLINFNIPGTSKYFALTSLLENNYLYNDNIELAKNKLSHFKKECTVPKYTEKINEMYSDLLIDLPDAIAPDFEVSTEEGKTFHLSKYKGKVVYISFWAHWCKPCIDGFQKSVELRKDLEKIGIVLLNVNLDKEDSLWKKALSEYNIYGTNVMSTNLETVKKLYALYSIPAYFIIDKNGKFAYLSDDENRDIMQEFKNLVNQ